MGWIGPAIGAAGAVAGLFKRDRRPDISRAVAELRASQPTGYTTPQDFRGAELTKGRIAEGVRRQGELAGYEVRRRSRARGLAGSPSEERALARVGQQTALGVEHAGETAEEQLYNTRLSREAYGREKDLAIFGAQAGEATRAGARSDAQMAAFYNSLNEFIPTILSYLPGGPTYAGSADRNVSA